VHEDKQLGFDSLRQSLVKDIFDVADVDGDLDGLINDAKLPFDVEVPHLDKTEDKLERILDRSGHLGLEAIKKDLEFNDFLGNILQKFMGMKSTAPGRPELDSASVERPDAPHAIERPNFAHVGRPEFHRPNFARNSHAERRPRFARTDFARISFPDQGNFR